MTTRKETGDSTCRGQVPGNYEGVSRACRPSLGLADLGIMTDETWNASVAMVGDAHNLQCANCHENGPAQNVAHQELPQHIKVDGLFTEEELEQTVDEVCLQKIAMYCHVYKVVWIRLVSMLEIQPFVEDTVYSDGAQGDEEFLYQLFHTWWTHSHDKRVSRLVRALCGVGMRDAINELKRSLVVKKLKQMQEGQQKDQTKQEHCPKHSCPVPAPQVALRGVGEDAKEDERSDGSSSLAVKEY